MWFSASTKHFVGMNRFGKLEKIIDLGDRFILHHDYALDDDGNIVSPRHRPDTIRPCRAGPGHQGQHEHWQGDEARRLRRDVPRLQGSTGHSGIDESDPTASGRWDWIHFNTIQLLPDGQYYIYMFDNDFA